MKSVQIVNGGPAFPTTFRNEGDLNVFAPDGAVVPPDGEHQLLGMSLRDYFAAKAMTALLSQMTYGNQGQHSAMYDPNDRAQAVTLAHLAYQAADAMLAEREK